jgi:uncharacterized Fe-S cluster protein YjdI
VLDAIRNRKGLSLKNVTQVLGHPGPVAITLQNPWMGPIAAPTVDIVSLCELCQLTSPSVAFEIGTGRGCTALHLALNAADDAVVYTLDLPPQTTDMCELPMTSQDRLIIDLHQKSTDLLFANTPVEHRINCLFGDSAVFDFSPFYGKVDLFFVDGAHSYEYVRSDTMNALRCCHSGSVIAWHDFGRRGLNGVTRWVLKLSHLMPIYAIPGGSLAYAVTDDPAEVVKALQSK